MWDLIAHLPRWFNSRILVLAQILIFQMNGLHYIFCFEYNLASAVLIFGCTETGFHLPSNVVDIILLLLLFAFKNNGQVVFTMLVIIQITEFWFLPN